MTPEDIEELKKIMVGNDDMIIIQAVEGETNIHLKNLEKSVRCTVGFLLVNNIGFTPSMWDYDWDELGNNIENVRKHYHITLREKKLTNIQTESLQNWFTQIANWYNEKCGGHIDPNITS